MTYLEEVQKGMDLLASDSRTIFMGQAMEFKGHAVSRQVEKYPKEQKLEFPVAEELQAGFALGMALKGYIPVCIYPRCNFAILAANQIVNHIDKWEALTGERVKVIIKMVVGSVKPMDPDLQHKANYAEAFDSMCDFTTLYNLTQNSEGMNRYGNDYVRLSYQNAFQNPESCIIVEDANLY